MQYPYCQRRDLKLQSVQLLVVTEKNQFHINLKDRLLRKNLTNRKISDRLIT